MITDGEIVKIGSFLKPHGIKGEINFEADYEIDIQSLKCIILKVDGINVPFFVKSVRPRSVYSYLVSIDGIDSELSAKAICNENVYALTADVADFIEQPDGDDGRFYLSDLIGFALIIGNDNHIGKIIDYDDTTDNVLLIVSPESDPNEKILVPVADDFIEEIDAPSKTIKMNLPEGLIDLNK